MYTGVPSEQCENGKKGKTTPFATMSTGQTATVFTPVSVFTYENVREIWHAV